MIFVALGFLLGGCGYVHFGRLPAPSAAMTGDAASAEAYSNLLTEQKMLKQELALARKESDALRAALDRGPAGSPELVAQLNDTARELAALRASYAKLQAERGAGASDATRAQASELEEKLATSLRNFTALQDENAQLRRDLSQAHAENATLADQLKASTARTEQAESALTQLNTELLAQKEARARAEQTATAARAQLAAVLAAPHSTPPEAGEGSAATSATAALQLAKAPPADLSATAELRTNPERLRASEKTASMPPSPPAEDEPRTHVVQLGDTLEKIAKRYYGDPQRWTKIYAANNDLLRDGRPLKPGMKLQIP
ncbi:MAG TPA: LysM peptidoglycan-binding domain-containing protein [Opitutaceae bacterium]|nr:LysM peptidoglycan-binding domain-containing protein [Opitutaceae bacterium]